LLGPSDVRDALGLVPDRFMTIEGQISVSYVQAGLTVADKINARANMLPLDRAIDSAYDPYALVRNIWFQRRDNKVHGDAARYEQPLDSDDPSP
jgi:phospholipid-binding lipoprotein MlaA